MYQFSENIQRGILYLLKSDLDFFLQIINLVKSDYFEYPSHAKLFDTVKDHYEKYHQLPNDDFLHEDIKKSLGANEKLSDYKDELHYINNLDTSSLTNTGFYLDLIESFAKKEAMKRAVAESVMLIKEDRIDEVEEKVREALLVCRTVDVGQDYFTSYTGRWEREAAAGKGEKYRTILPGLDSSLEGGLGKKELAMVVAPPGVGKSLYLVNQSVRSLIDGKKVLYISLEMSEDKIAQRFDSVMTLVSQARIKDSSGKLTVKERLEMFQENFPGSRLMIKEFPSTIASVNTLRSLLVQLKN